MNVFDFFAYIGQGIVWLMMVGAVAFAFIAGRIYGQMPRIDAMDSVGTEDHDEPHDDAS